MTKTFTPKDLQTLDRFKRIIDEALFGLRQLEFITADDRDYITFKLRECIAKSEDE